MRLSVKVAPGVRISGRIGGRHHHHHHYRRRGGGTWGVPARRSGDWLHSIPPWRIPLPRVYGIGSLIGLMIMAEIGAIVWFYEFAAWLTVWMFVGMFIVVRAVVQAVAGRRSPTRPDADLTPRPEHIDLGRL